MTRLRKNHLPERNDPRAELGLRPVINVSGTMTALGASIIVPEAIEAMMRMAPEFVEMTDLQRKASPVIARLTGADAGTVTACCSAGITMAIAACMTGPDLGKIEQLPYDASIPSAGGTKNEVPLQLGHMVSYGAPVTQAIRLTGARVVPIGEATGTRGYQLEAVLSEVTAAALYVVSHHVIDHGQIPLPDFANICHERNVPVVVDAASEYDLRLFLDQGADLVIYSGHKFLGGPTSGIVAGRKDLVAAAYLQNFGICRGMKIGKESMAGLIATLEAWEHRDHAAVRARENSHLNLWQQRLAACPGVHAEILPDPTNNPLDRLRLHIDPAAAGCAAWDLAKALAAGDPPVVVRDHMIERGFFDMDPCNLHDGEAAAVADRIVDTLEQARIGKLERHSLAWINASKTRGLVEWLG